MAGEEKLVSQRRAKAIPMIVDGETVVITDQSALIFENVALASNWIEEDLITHLNEHVFFWPGGSNAPVKAGIRFHKHYEEEQPAIIRVPTADLLACNHSQKPLFCPFNSGAPRKQAGNAVRRGPDLFLPAPEFPRTAGRVVELVFRGAVRLPDTTELRLQHDIWTKLSAI
jgi:hypothetical protein